MNEAFEALLTNRGFLYAYLSRAFATEADEAFLTVAGSEHAQEACALIGEETALAQCSLSAGLRGLIDPEKLKSEYTKLFVGPARLPASPWESVYASGEPLLFQESTLAVREAYAKEGFRAASYPHEPDDHVATELSFMAALSERTMRAFEKEDIEQCKQLLSAQADFLQNHLLVWIREFSDRLNEVDGISSFYPSFASLAALVCERDVEVIEELQAAL